MEKWEFRQKGKEVGVIRSYPAFNHEANETGKKRDKEKQSEGSRACTELQLTPPGGRRGVGIIS